MTPNPPTGGFFMPKPPDQNETKTKLGTELEIATLLPNFVRRLVRRWRQN